MTESRPLREGRQTRVRQHRPMRSIEKRGEQLLAEESLQEDECTIPVRHVHKIVAQSCCHLCQFWASALAEFALQESLQQRVQSVGVTVRRREKPEPGRLDEDEFNVAAKIITHGFARRRGEHRQLAKRALNI